MESTLITSDMVEAAEFPHLAHKYNVAAVPKTVMNETTEFEGALPEQELMRKFEEQLRQFPIPLLIGDEVAKLSEADNFFAVQTSKGKRFRSKAVIIASGRRARSLDVPGEKDLIGRGVSYCATCDAPLFDGMDVAVIGSGNPAITAVNDLTKYARKIRKGCGET